MLLSKFENALFNTTSIPTLFYFYLSALKSLEYHRATRYGKQNANSHFRFCAGSLEGALQIGSNGPWAVTQLSKTSS